MKKYFVISDIHARIISLDNFKEKGFDKNDENHIIIMLGDYFDRNFYNKEVLNFIEETKTILSPERFILLLGNHDQYAKDLVDSIIEKSDIENEIIDYDKNKLMFWILSDGAQSIKDLIGDITDYRFRYDLKAQKKVKRLSHILDNLENYHETKNYIFTHAYINDNYEINTNSRYYLNNEVDLNKTVVVGHTTFRKLKQTKGFIRKDELVLSGSVMINEELKNSAYFIDNGEGNNIIVIEDSSLTN